MTIAKPKNHAEKDEPWDPTGIPVIFTAGGRLRPPTKCKDAMIDNRFTILQLHAPLEKTDRRVCRCARCFARVVFGLE